MKQMSKEELIEYFIEQLGDNEILGQIMSIEQIREKLNYIVKDVTYHDEPGNFAGEWVINKNGTGTVNFDIRKISKREEKQIIVHELLHALSTSSRTQEVEKKCTFKSEKCGILFVKKIYRNDNNKFTYYDDKNIAINEGMTDFLAEQITGSMHDGYNAEKSIYKVLSIIIGQDTLIKKAFGENVNISQDGLDIFREELIAKYGEWTGNEFNEKFKKVSVLSDQLLDFFFFFSIYGLNEDGRRIQSQAKDEVLDTLASMLSTILNFNIAHNLNKKIDMMIKLEKMCDYRDTDLFQIRKMVSSHILWELFLDESIDYTQKIEMIRKIKEQGIQFQDKAIDDLLFSIEGFPELSIDERIEAYIQLQKGKILTPDISHRIYELYVRSGKIVENGYSKRKLVEMALEEQLIDTVEKIDRSITDTKYYKLGEYYALPRGDNPMKTVIFNEEGKLLYEYKLMFDPIEDKEIYKRGDIKDIKLLNGHFSEDKVKIISENLKRKFEQYRLLAKGTCSDRGVTIIGNIIRVHYQDWIDEPDHYYVDFYSVNNDGNLELIPKRRKTQNYR